MGGKLGCQEGREQQGKQEVTRVAPVGYPARLRGQWAVQWEVKWELKLEVKCEVKWGGGGNPGLICMENT